MAHGNAPGTSTRRTEGRDVPRRAGADGRRPGPGCGRCRERWTSRPDFPPSATRKPAKARTLRANAAESNSASSAPGATTRPMDDSAGMSEIAISPNDTTVVRLASISDGQRVLVGAARCCAAGRRTARSWIPPPRSAAAPPDAGCPAPPAARPCPPSVSTTATTSGWHTRHQPAPRAQVDAQQHAPPPARRASPARRPRAGSAGSRLAQFGADVDHLHFGQAGQRRFQIGLVEAWRWDAARPASHQPPPGALEHQRARPPRRAARRPVRRAASAAACARPRTSARNGSSREGRQRHALGCLGQAGAQRRGVRQAAMRAVCTSTLGSTRVTVS